MRISDWSSDVCSSDLTASAYLLRHAYNAEDPLPHSSPPLPASAPRRAGDPALRGHRIGVDVPARADRTSVVEGKSVSVRVDLGCRRIIKKKQSKKTHISDHTRSKSLYITHHQT